MSTSTSAPIPPTTQEPTMSEPARVVNVFFSPGKTFADINRRPSWWLPWLLISILSVAFMFVVDQKIGFDQITRNEIAKSSRADQFEKLPEDQKERQMQISTTVTKVFSYGSPVLNLIVFAIVAGVLMGTFNFGMGAEIPFGKALAVVIYAWLPKCLSAILGIISLLVGVDPEGFNIRNPVATNPAYFMSPMGNKFVYGIASMFDIIAIWMIILMGMGFAANSKLKRGTAIGVIVAWYVVIKLVGAGLAVAF